MNDWIRTLSRLALPAALLALGFVGGLTAQVTVPAPDAPFAVVNGRTLRYADFYLALQDEAGARAAERVIMTELLRQEAAKENVTIEPAEVTERLAGFIEEEFGGRMEAFVQWMGATGQDDETVRRRIQAELLAVKLRTRGVEVTEAALQEFFGANHEKLYDVPELVRFRQIVLDNEDKANVLLGDLKAGRISFFAAASEHSVDKPTAEEGGLVQPVPLKVLQEQAPPVFEALSKLGTNQMTEAPVSFGGKWLLLLLVERIPGKPATYEQVAARVRFDYLLSKASPEQELLDRLVAHSSITDLPARYRDLQIRLASVGLPRQPAAGPGTAGPQPPGN